MIEAAPISALNHLLFCRRRCALIHVEGLFVENVHTLEGRAAHESVDEPESCVAPGVRVERSLPVFSRRLGLVGKADVVEFRQGVPYPIEYKRGRRRRWDNDDVQLCAQALCLEEMTCMAVPAGAIYHVGSRRRREVLFDGRLRTLTEDAVRELHGLLDSRELPRAVLMPKCEECSLRGVCMPEVTSRPEEVVRHVSDLFRLRAST